jgi:small ligand-binding sensory domain FIST
MPFAAALSTHPVTAHAVGEVAGQVLEGLGPHPDLVLLFVTRPHAGALEDAAAAVRQILSPTVLVGCAAESVVGPGLEIEAAPAVSLWAGILGPVTPVRLSAVTGESPQAAHATQPAQPAQLIGWPDILPFEPQGLILIGDPYTMPVDVLFADLAERHPALPVLGGMASAALGPGGNRLALDDRIHTSGAVGVVIGPGTRLSTVVSQGCRPIGRPLVVTRSERNIVYELAGLPALERLLEMARAGMSERDIGLINQGLHLGLVIDEHKADFGRGDFLVRNVMGADQSNGAIAVGDIVEVGTTVQFHVRDADAADEDLRELLAPRTADGALLFTCNGRGSRLFAEPNHDAGVVGEALDNPPVAGFFAAGELGPVGGRNFMHGFTASLALFEEMNTS